MANKLAKPDRQNAVPAAAARHVAPSIRLPLIEAPSMPADGGALRFGRSEEEAQLWTQATDRLQTVLTKTGATTGELASNVRQIQKGFLFVNQPQDTDFSYLHIEPLIDQASDLFDRAIRD